MMDIFYAVALPDRKNPLLFCCIVLKLYHIKCPEEEMVVLYVHNENMG